MHYVPVRADLSDLEQQAQCWKASAKDAEVEVQEGVEVDMYGCGAEGTRTLVWCARLLKERRLLHTSHPARRVMHLSLPHPSGAVGGFSPCGGGPHRAPRAGARTKVSELRRRRRCDRENTLGAGEQMEALKEPAGTCTLLIFSRVYFHASIFCSQTQACGACTPYFISRVRQRGPCTTHTVPTTTNTVSSKTWYVRQ